MNSVTRALARTAIALAVALAIAAPATTAAAATDPTAVRPLRITTVPPIPGISVVLNGQTLTTGADGTIHTLVTARQREELSTDRDAHLVVATPQVVLSDGVRARFHGWYDGGYRFSAADRSGQVEVAAFDVDYRTSFGFVDSRGTRVDPRRVTSAELKDARGTTVETPGTRPVWLLGRSVLAGLGRVTSRDVEYRFTRVTVGKVNLVTRGEQRFIPRYNQRVRVTLKLFTIKFHAHDAIFGSPRGSAIDIEMPDGTTRHAALRDGRATVTGLPPGKYVVTTKATGLGREQTFVFSKDDTAEIQIIDPVDLGLVFLVLGLIGALLIVAGLRMRRKRRRRTASASDDEPIAVPPREPVMSRSGASREVGSP